MWNAVPLRPEIEKLNANSQHAFSMRGEARLTEKYRASHGSNSSCHRDNERDEPLLPPGIGFWVLNFRQEGQLAEKPSSLGSRHDDGSVLVRRRIVGLDWLFLILSFNPRRQSCGFGANGMRIIVKIRLLLRRIP